MASKKTTTINQKLGSLKPSSFGNLSFLSSSGQNANSTIPQYKDIKSMNIWMLPGEVISGTPQQYVNLIKEAAKANNLPASLLSALFKNESSFNPKAKNVNRMEKSYGLAQINTLAHKVTRKQAEDPKFAINFAAKRLGEMVKKYGLFEGIQAYNTPGAIGSKQLIDYATKVLKYSGADINAAKSPQNFANLKANTVNAGITKESILQKMSQLGNKTADFGGKTKYEDFHPGVDIANAKGTPIPAFASGTVVKKETGYKNGDNGFGNKIVIKDKLGAEQSYNHLERPEVEVGQQVQQGQEIAKMGNTGSVYSKSGKGDGTHLDYRIVDSYNKYVNPYTHFNKLNQ